MNTFVTIWIISFALAHFVLPIGKYKMVTLNISFCHLSNVTFNWSVWAVGRGSNSCCRLKFWLFAKKQFDDSLSIGLSLKLTMGFDQMYFMKWWVPGSPVQPEPEQWSFSTETGQNIPGWTRSKLVEYPRSRFLKVKKPPKSHQKYIFCFLYMTQIPPKNIFLDKSWVRPGTT